MRARINPKSSCFSSFSLKKKIPPRVTRTGQVMAMRETSMAVVLERPWYRRKRAKKVPSISKGMIFKMFFRVKCFLICLCLISR